MKQGEKILPHPDILNEVEYGRFVLTNLAAKRAKQIKEGAPPLVRIDSGHPLSIALAEIAAGKIKPVMLAEGDAVEGAADYSALDGLELGEIGLLLPAIEEDIDMAAVIGIDEDDLHEDETEHHEDDEIGGLADLLGDEEETLAPVAEDGDMSLDDLAEQEESESDEDGEEAQV